MTRQEFMAIAAYIGVGCGKPLSREALEVYFDLLGDLPADALQTAARRVLLEHPWSSFPSVAELRQAAADTIQGQVHGVSPAEAWRMAWDAISNIDPEIETSVTKAMEKLQPAVAESVRSMGILNLCYGKEPVAVIRAQFVKAYEQIATREKRLALMPKTLREAIEQPKKELAAPIKQAIEGVGKAMPT